MIMKAHLSQAHGLGQALKTYAYIKQVLLDPLLQSGLLIKRGLYFWRFKNILFLLIMWHPSGTQGSDTYVTRILISFILNSSCVYFQH